MLRRLPSLLTAAAVVAAALASLGFVRAPLWSDTEIERIGQLSIANLPPLPADPSNRVADDERAAELGQRLFFDGRLSANGQVSCASCHLPDRQFQDGTPLARGIGTTDRRTMSIVGTARSPWQFWDGRKDSQWSQALGPLESPVEHGGDRTQYAHVLAGAYLADYERIFGKMPAIGHLPKNAGPVANAQAAAAWQAMPAPDRDKVDAIFANLGKAIAAYERRIEPGPSRFDAYADAAARGDAARMAATLSRDEIAGLKLFIGRANCIQCHAGPLFTNNEFHNTGVPLAAGGKPDSGRLAGARQVLADEFNCLGRHSDAKPEQCGEIRFLAEGSDNHLRQFRAPSLRNVAERAPYMHAGQFATLEDVVRHYNRAPAAPQGHSELQPLGLDATEVKQLVAFLKTLSGPLRSGEKWLKAPAR
ncbi:cytochrome-c peroxidase [Ramlibacter sp. PS4R-6]|uniref:cytochrome-c peroxidase n=1 Tax=Ramlibacter sp. PS4R-6 TaxID=3133438 RepID=UPI0030AD9F59